MKRILIPVDFSEVSHKAMLFASQIASDMEASITLLHVHSDTSSLVKRPFSGAHKQKLADSEFERLMEDLSALIIDNEFGNNEVTWTIVDRTKKTSSHIADFMEDHDLLVMGTNGANQIEDHIVGSTTTAVIDKVDKPVIALPGSFVFDGKLDHVMLVADYDDFPMDSFAKVKLYLAKLDPKITALDINLGHNPVIDRISKDLTDELKDVDFQTVDSNDEIKAIVEFATNNNVDLVAMPTKRRNWWQRLFERSYAENLVLSTKVAIMSV